MPVFYDLEEFPEWDGHFPPTSTNTYVNIANQFFSKLEAAGYTNLQVYSGKNYLTTVLNAPSIVSKASWVAQYGPRLKYEISADSGVKGWQYSSSGSVSGIHGNVDMNAFSLVPYWRERLGLYGFVDVFSSTPHHEHIGWLKENGIAAGWADGTFKPYVSIARCDMAAFLYRLAGSPQYSPTSAERRRFKDVDGGTPHCDEVWWLASTGVSTGWADGTFKPYASIARCDMAAFLYRLAGSPQYSPTSAERRRFKDVDGGTPHCDEVWWLASTGVSTGWADGTFKPYASIARCDMAAFLHRFFDNVGVGI